LYVHCGYSCKIVAQTKKKRENYSLDRLTGKKSLFSAQCSTFHIIDPKTCFF
jgi:hypothetical protein